MKTIWKFPLGVIDEQVIQMPKGAKILTVQTQGAAVCLWALCDPSRVVERRVIGIVGTGHDIADELSLDYIGTFQIHGGALVFHAFELL